MHLEARDMYHLNFEVYNVDGCWEPQMHEDVSDPECWDVKMDNTKYTSAIFPPLVWMERNHNGGLDAVVRSPRFKDFPPLIFKFPPITFTTHQMDDCGGESEWTLQVKQKREDSRLRLKLYNKEKFGFRVRLPARRYDTLEDVFIQAQYSYIVEEDEHGLYKTKPAERTVYVTSKTIEHVDFDLYMVRENEKALARLGDWRPGKPDLTNVVQIEDYMERVENVEVRNIPVDIEQLLSKLG